MAEIKFDDTVRAGYKRLDKSYGLALDILWETMGDDDTGQWIEAGAFADKTVVFAGTIGAGTVLLQGSNDQTNLFTCTDQTGTAISTASLTTPVGALVAENPRWIRPVTASGSSNDIDVRIYARLVM